MTDCDSDLSCGYKGCAKQGLYVVSVFFLNRGPRGELVHVVDSYACEEHAKLPGVLIIGDLVYG
jgi:hypothetical protein